MSYDVGPQTLDEYRLALANEQERTRSMKRERDANYDALERARAALARERERADRAEAALRRVKALKEKWDATAERYAAESNAPTRNDDDRRTALAKFTASVSLRDVVNHLRAALAGSEGGDR